MVQDYFRSALAVSTTGALMPGAEADVYALSDTTHTTPLDITDRGGTTMSKLVAGLIPLYPEFVVPTGETEVVAVSGDLETPLTSQFGFILELLPDPAAASDGLVLATSSGEYTLIPSSFTPIPDPTLAEDGQVMTVVDGVWDVADPTGGGGVVGGVLDGGAP